jgi:hypothetical protein
LTRLKAGHLVQLVGQQDVAFHLEHAVAVSLVLVGPADVLPQQADGSGSESLEK